MQANMPSFSTKATIYSLNKSIWQLAIKCCNTGSPESVSLNARSSRSLSMTWTSPANLNVKHGSFVAYAVQCWSKGQTTAAYKLANVTQVLIEQCLPYSAYNCCVSLQTTQANSTAVCQQQRTPEDGKLMDYIVTLSLYLVAS